MKVKVKIPKIRCFAPIDFNDVTVRHSVCGIELSYTEYDFMQLEQGSIVLFDAYSAAHKYTPFDVECGIVTFPFFCGCMTDKGERVAYAGLRFSEDRAEKWIPLRVKNVSDRSALDPTSGGIPITSGVCCIADESAYNVYRSHMKDDVPPLAGLIVLDGQTHTVLELYGKRYAVFSTGWGDGRFDCYAGIAADGKVTAVIADFGMIDYGGDWNELVETEIEVDDGVGVFVYDHTKSEQENNVERWTVALGAAEDDVARLRAYSRRGYAYHSMNDSDRALADYMAAVECSKKITDRLELMRSWSVYDNAAEIFCARGDHESAIKLMLCALDVLGTLYAGAYVRLIDLYQLVKRSDKALDVATKMCEARPDDPVAHIKYAECCISVMDYASAAQAYDTLASRFELYENLFDEASCFIELGDYDGALAALEKHPAREAYEQYWYYRAYIEYKRHRLFSALELAEKSHALDAEYMPALYLLIDVESLLNEYFAVARYAEEYKKLRPDNEYGYSICADAHMILGNFSESARNYCHLYDSIKNDDKYGALAAIVCSRTGDNKKCASILKKLRRKKNEYYLGALYGAGISKLYNNALALERTANRLSADYEFLVMLSVFLLQTNYIMQATHILDVFFKGDNLPYEAVAQQIRAAEKIGDKKHFLSFLEYYINKFIDAHATTKERRRIGAAFICQSKHASWLDELE